MKEENEKWCGFQYHIEDHIHAWRIVVDWQPARDGHSYRMIECVICGEVDFRHKVTYTKGETQ